MTALDEYGPEFVMLLAVLLVLVGLTERKLSVTQQRSRRFRLACAQALASYMLILDVQLICGLGQYVSDGVLRVGFPDDFYRASIWWPAPTFDCFALIADLILVSLIATLYACARMSSRYSVILKRDRR